MEITVNHSGFDPRDIGKTIQMKVSWWARLKYFFNRYIRNQNPDPPGLFVITDVKFSTSAMIEPAYICASCKRIRPWSFGADDRHFELCDDCCAERD